MTGERGKGILRLSKNKILNYYMPLPQYQVFSKKTLILMKPYK